MAENETPYNPGEGGERLGEGEFDPNESQGQSAASKAASAISEKSQKAQRVVSTFNKVRTAASTATKTATTVAPVLGNPIFWIILLVVVVVVIAGTGIVAATQLFGRTSSADGCYGIGQNNSSESSSGIQATDSGDWIANANSVAAWMMSTKFDFLGGKPMSLNQAAGIIGNWSQESTMNPKATQSGFNPGASNAELKALGSMGGRAVGLAQWDGGRRTALAEYADSQNKVWSDINVQLAYFKKELEGAEGANLVAAGFNDTSKTAKELVQIFEHSFERAGKPVYEARFAGAEKFLANFDGGYGGGGGAGAQDTGGSCLQAEVGGSGMDTSSVAQLAISLAWPTLDQSRIKGDVNGGNVVKPEYKEAKAKAMSTAGADGMAGLYASCDRFVATVLKLTVDKSVPWGSTIEQGKYFANSSKWQQYTKKSEAKPGDVWVTKTRGHIVMYVGNVGGVDSIAHASFHQRVGGVGPSNYLNENLVDTGGRAYYGYHYVGGADGTDG